MMTLLVLQFKADGALESFGKLVSFEETLSSVFGQLAEVDGHDLGSGEMNIFIITDQPIAAFVKVQQTNKSIWPDGEMRAAYRRIDGEEYCAFGHQGCPTFNLRNFDCGRSEHVGVSKTGSR